MNFFDDIYINEFTSIEQKYLSNVQIEKILKKKDNSYINVFLISSDFIPYDLILKIKHIFKHHIFDLNNLIVDINLKYNFSSQYNLTNIYEMDSENIFKEIKDTNKILYSILKSSNISINNNNLYLDIIKLNRLNYKVIDIKNFLEGLFKNRYNINVNVCINENEEINNNIKNEIIKNEQKKQEVFENNIKKELNNNLNVSSSASKIEISNENKNRKFEFYNEDVNIYGKILQNNYVIKKLNTIDKEEKEVIVQGTIFNVEYKEIKNDCFVFNFYLTDEESSIKAEIFIFEQSKHIDTVECAKQKLKVGVVVAIKGSIRYSQYEHELVLANIKSIKVLKKKSIITIKAKPPEKDQYIFTTERLDNSIEKRVEFHLHTKYSDNDAVGAVEDYIEAANRFGMKSMAITDHGCVQGLADAYAYISQNQDKKIKIINGVEGYLVDDELSTYMNSDFKETNENISFDDEFIIIDTFQSGINSKKDKIIKINAIKIKDGQVIDSFSQFANPDKPLTFEVKNKTGLRDEMLCNQQDEKSLLNNFFVFAKNSKVLINHIPLSALTFFKYRCIINGIVFDKNILDLAMLSRTLVDKIKKTKLDNIVKQLKIKNKNLLDEQNRIDALKEIFIILLNKLKMEYNIENLYDFQLKFKKDNDFVKRLQYYHIVLLAKNDVGRVNLYKLVSESYVNYFYKKPRMPRSLINKYREGLIIGSACISGELMDAIKNGVDDDELIKIASFYDYLEIQPVMNNSFLFEKDKYNFKNITDLEQLNKKVVEIGSLLDKLVIATCDSHYVDKEDKIYRTILKYGEAHKKTNENNKLLNEKDVANSDLVETKNDETGDDVLSNEELYFRTTDEMLKEFEYLGEEKAYEVVVKNTNIIDNMIEDDILPMRLDKCPPIIENSDNELRDSCFNKLKEIYGENPPKDFVDRLNMELDMIIKNGFSVMYISAKRVIDESMRCGYSVGSRGSVGSSFAANMAGITEVNPLPPHYVCPNCKYVEYDTEETNKYYNSTAFDMPDKLCPHCKVEMRKDGVNIPFETFLGVEGGKPKEPDIDLNFASEFQSNAQDFTKKIFGNDHVFKAGTVATYKEKNAFGYVKKYCEGNALMFRKPDIDRLKNGLIRVKRTTGQHPGGMIVVPNDEEIYTFTPIQYPANKESSGLTTHYDYHKIEENLLKLDMLGHDTPSILKKLYDLTNVNPFTVKFYDDKVMELFHSTESLGIPKNAISTLKLGTLSIPEFGTANAMNTLLVAKPKSIADLIRLSGLSHGEGVWQGNSEDLIKNGIAKLEDCVCCRDDIMVYLSYKGIDKGLAFDIMEKVRKGKGLTIEYEKAMRDVSLPDWYIDSCKKIKYMFPKAHAAAYVITALRFAYYKVYYPAEYYASYFSVKIKHLDYEAMCTTLENVRFYLNKNKLLDNEGEEQKYDNDFDDSDSQSEDKGDSLIRNMKITEEMLVRGIEWLPIDINKAKATDFLVIDGKIMPSFVSIVGLGEKKALFIEEEQKKGEFKSIKDFKNRTRVSSSIIDKMKSCGIFNNLQDDDEKNLFDLF